MKNINKYCIFGAEVSAVTHRSKRIFIKQARSHGNNYIPSGVYVVHLYRTTGFVLPFTYALRADTGKIMKIAWWPLKATKGNAANVFKGLTNSDYIKRITLCIWCEMKKRLKSVARKVLIASSPTVSVSVNLLLKAETELSSM